jgi:hypothetical protein
LNSDCLGGKFGVRFPLFDCLETEKVENNTVPGPDN